jgi:DNA-binding transcriptional regulator LsrR (DeoR family)
MHYIEGRKRTEIADALGTSRRTVYGRLKRLTQLATEISLPPES